MTGRIWLICLLGVVCLLPACTMETNEPAAGEAATRPAAVIPTEPVALPATPTAPTSPTATSTLETASATVPTDSDGTASDQADADVLFVRAVQEQDGTWTFHVTVAHPDMGWEDYADGWDVVTPEGTVLRPDSGSPFTRLLLHPHDNEQPFTRSQSGIKIPEGVTTVTVRAHDLRHGFGGQEVVVDLTEPAGENFEVETP